MSKTQQAEQVRKLNVAILANSDTFITRMYPAAVKRGIEYAVGDILGSPGKSVMINPETGDWADFADETHKLRGKNLLSLYAVRYGLEWVDAIAALMPEYFPPSEPKIPGNPSLLTKYLDEMGKTRLIVARYDLPDGGKDMRPYTIKGTGEWGLGGSYNKLYNLQALIPADNVLIVEGEKCAHAAESMEDLPYVPTTWHGGVNKIKKIEWTPLEGKNVLIFPDNDTPGISAAVEIAEKLIGLRCNVRILDVHKADKPQKWDIADALIDKTFTDTPSFLEWGKKYSKIIESEPSLPPPGEAPLSNQEPGEAGAPPASLTALYAGAGITHSKMKVHPSPDNIHAMLEWLEMEGKAFVRMDIFSGYAGIKIGAGRWQELSETRLSTLFRMMDSTFMLRGSIRFTLFRMFCLEFAETKRSWDSAKTFFEELPKWDGEKRIDKFLHEYFGADDCPISDLPAKHSSWP